MPQPKKPNKYLYQWIVQGHYGYHGWEDVTADDNRRIARAELRTYRNEEPQYPHRLIYGRRPNPDFVAKLPQVPQPD